MFSALENITKLLDNIVSSNIDASPLKYISKLLNDFSKLLNEPNFYDVEIKVGLNQQDLETFKAHSAILKSRSSYFNVALSNNWIKRMDNGIIIFEKSNVSPKIFGIILE